MAKNQHVVPHGNKWAVKGEGNQRATKVAPTQKAAIAAARAIARRQGTDVIIHGATGRVRDSYGTDPFPPRDLAD